MLRSQVPEPIETYQDCRSALPRCGYFSAADCFCDEAKGSSVRLFMSTDCSSSLPGRISLLSVTAVAFSPHAVTCISAAHNNVEVLKWRAVQRHQIRPILNGPIDVDLAVHVAGQRSSCPHHSHSMGASSTARLPAPPTITCQTAVPGTSPTARANNGRCTFPFLWSSFDLSSLAKWSHRGCSSVLPLHWPQVLGRMESAALPFLRASLPPYP